MVLKKQIEILKRQARKQVKTRFKDRLFFVIFHKVSNIKNMIRIVQPETLLKWRDEIINKRWTYKTKKKVGRPPVAKETKLLILEMKNSNSRWGAKRIRDELFKLGTELEKTTIRNILRDFRKKGKIKASLTWEKFLRAQIDSIFAMDFLTVDTITGIRFYVYFIIEHKSRKIVQFAVTKNPLQEFVRQQLICFREIVSEKVYMIHDGTGEFIQNYKSLGICNVKTSTRAPNMNAIAERFIGSLRREALDFFFIFSQKQLKKIISEYISFYNERRPHQSLNQNSPVGYEVQKKGKIMKKEVLSGLTYDYFRLKEVPK